jgi:hypothetical protein
LTPSLGVAFEALSLQVARCHRSPISIRRSVAPRRVGA